MEYYEQLLEECSYLQIDYERLDKMKTTLLKMKSSLNELKIKKVQARIQLINSYIHKQN